MGRDDLMLNNELRVQDDSLQKADRRYVKYEQCDVAPSSTQSLDLQNRLITFSVMIINLLDRPIDSYAARHLANQLIRSSTSAAINYGEARSAESKKDFIHKMQLSLKELRESLISLKILYEMHSSKHIKNDLERFLSECDELVAIFVKSVKTSKSKA